MIAHVAQSGEDRGRVVIQIRSRHPSAVAMQAAVQIARAFGSDLESLFVEDEQLFDCAAYGFVREISLSGLRRSRCAAAWCATSRCARSPSPAPSRARGTW
jgi:hypothetical protein